MTDSPTKSRRAAIASAFSVLFLAAVVTAPPALASGGHVLPPQASPHGYSLTKMAKATAPFGFNGNDPALYPNTPFQILYIDGYDVEEVDSGIVATGHKSFTAPRSSLFYVPIFSLTDNPSFLAPFPETPAAASSYFFDQAQHGANFTITVDGSTTPIGPGYVVGPVELGGTNLHIVTLGVYLTPLSLGSHTITVHGGIYGAGVDDAYGIAFIEENFTYTVQVTQGK